MNLIKKIGNFIAVAFFGMVISSADGQSVISGSPNVFSNSQATAAIPMNSIYVTPYHTLSVNHEKLLTTTNFSIYYQIGIVDAVTGATNFVNVAQVWQSQNTNSTTENVTLTNYQFTIQTRLVLTTTNAMNLPGSLGGATYVTNTIIFN